MGSELKMRKNKKSFIISVLMRFGNLARYLYFSESSGRRWLVDVISPTLFLFSSWNDANETTSESWFLPFTQEFKFQQIQEVFKRNNSKGNSIISENNLLFGKQTGNRNSRILTRQETEYKMKSSQEESSQTMKFQIKSITVWIFYYTEI